MSRRILFVGILALLVCLIAMKRYTNKKYLESKWKAGYTANRIAKENGVHVTTILKYTLPLGIRFTRSQNQEQDHSEKIGMRVGIMKVVGFDGYRISRSGKSKMPYLQCQCDCGRLTTIPYSQLRIQQSCGCLKCKSIEMEELRQDVEYDDAAFNGLYAVYRRGAITSNRKFDLTKQEFYTLTKQNCHYCGIEPKQNFTQRRKSFWNFYRYNGIDRLNNTLGYVMKNVVTACKQCNKAKSTLDYESFVVWIERLSNFHKCES